MKYLLCFFFFLSILLEISALAQQSMAPLKLESYAFTLDVTPDEKYIIGTRAGEVAIADSLTGYWRSCPPATDGSILKSARIHQINFFTATTGILSGNNDNVIYRTPDAGKSWQKVDFGLNGWVDGTWSLDNGEAWMSVSGQGIAYTADYGLTWQHLPIVETKQQRYSALYFNTKKEGIVGSLWNLIGYTNDNCRHWQRVPTPLDQKAYTKTNRSARPEINDIAIFGDYFLATQESMVFFTHRDSIHWQALPGYVGFNTDANNDVLYLIKGNNQVVRAGNHLEAIYQYPKASTPQARFCRNGSLFTTNGREVVQYKNDNSLRVAAMTSDKPASVAPVIFGYYEMQQFAVAENKIYAAPFSADGRETNDWKEVLTLPFTVKDPEKLSYLSPDELLYSASDDSLCYYNIKTETVDIASLSSLFATLETNGVTSITFSQGSRGCFHGYSQDLVYALQGNQYILTEQTSDDEKVKPIRAGAREIDAAVVNAFLRRAINPYTKRVTVRDLGFTTADFARCKKDIRHYQQEETSKKKKKKSSRLEDTGESFSFNKNNVDFDRLVALVDSIPIVDSLTLEHALLEQGRQFTSTTSNWVKIELKDNQNNILEITHRYYSVNSFCLPWEFEIRNATTTSMDFEITRFIQTYCPGLIPGSNKVPLLHTLVRMMYK